MADGLFIEIFIAILWRNVHKIRSPFVILNDRKILIVIPNNRRRRMEGSFLSKFFKIPHPDGFGMTIENF